MWYNDGTNIVVSEGAVNTAQTLINLSGRSIVNTVPHSAENGNPQIYTIYALIDPRDQAIRYVGITYAVYQRMRQHSRCEGYNEAKNTWIQELQREQLMFIMHSLEKVETVEEALDREKVWIEHLLKQGANLTNIAGLPTGSLELPRQSTTISPGLAEQLFFRTSTGGIVNIPYAPHGEFDAFIRRYTDLDERQSKTSKGIFWDKAQRRHAISHILKHGPEYGVFLDLCD